MRLKEFQYKIAKMLSEHPDIEDIYVEYPATHWDDGDYSIGPVEGVEYWPEIFADEEGIYYDREDWLEQWEDEFDTEEEAEVKCNSLAWHPAIIVGV